jgi:excisionase family DNA binding protein
MPRVSVPTSGRVMTAKEAAGYLSVHPVTMYRWIEERQIPSFELSARAVRVRQEDLDRFIESKRRA